MPQFDSESMAGAPARVQLYNLSYSSRNATTGSTVAARRAGK
jgi:hypothetical protein